MLNKYNLYRYILFMEIEYSAGEYYAYRDDRRGLGSRLHVLQYI